MSATNYDDYAAKVPELKFSPEDVDMLLCRAWSVQVTTTKHRYLRTERGLFHRYVAQRMLGRKLERWELVDHINHDTLDNRRENLRVVTNSVNQQNRRDNQTNNTSGARGVTWDESRRMWFAQAFIGGKAVIHKRFKNKEDAAKFIDRFWNERWKVRDEDLADFIKCFKYNYQREALLNRRANGKLGIRGVSFVQSRNKYRARATQKKRGYFLGDFDTIEEAKGAVDAFWIEHADDTILRG